MQKKMGPLLSVIVPTRNRAGLLRKALESFTKQKFDLDQFEILVIDNGSTDDTREVVERYHRILQISYLYDSKPGLHICRNLGFQKSRSDIIVYCDDDIQASPEWLSSIYEGFQNPKVSMVGGRNLPDWECRPPEWLHLLWEKRTLEGQFLPALSILDFGDKVKYIDPGYVWGCNFSIRKDILVEAKGFHPDGMPDDLIKFRGDGETYVSDFVRESGYRALYHPGAIVHHFVPASRMTPEYFYKRFFNQAISDMYTKFRQELRGDL